ncbi:MAG TPA: energy transducer TonB, partial [Prolixibacteraceae bacterium]
KADVNVNVNAKADVNISTNANVKADVNVNSKSQQTKEGVFIVVEAMPQFPGGDQACKDFIVRTLKYPAEAIKKSITGKVIVTFIVNKNGKVENAKVVQAVDPALDKEAIRVISMLPDWKPGKQRGVNVDVVYTMPIEFALQ